MNAAEKEDLKTENEISRDFVGHIDSYNAGFIHGWAWSKNEPSQPLLISVYLNGKVAGEGKADIFREDLKVAGFGTGRYGFRIKIITPPLEEITEVTLIEKQIGLKISTNEFKIKLKELATIEVESIRWGYVFGKIKTLSDLGEKTELTIIGDNGSISGGGHATKSSENVYSFQVKIPADLCDDQIHLLTISLKDHPGVETAYLNVIPSVITPWEHISSSINNINYPALVRTSGYRYDSLQRQLVDINDEKELKNLLNAHEVVKEGWQSRKQFLPLTLPYYEYPEVSIIIPVHNKFELTYHCLASLILAWNKLSYEVIVVDDCSTDKTLELNEIVTNVNLIVNEYNLGFLRNCNKAVKQARGNYVVMLNNDTEVTSGWLDELHDTFQRFDNVGMSGSKLIYPDGSLQEAGGIVWGNGQPWNLGNRGNPQDPQWNYARQADYLSGAALMIPRKIWDEVGGFSDEFAPAYYEDTDLAFKIRAAGYKTVYAPYSVVIHFEGMSNGRDESQGIKKNQVINAPKFRAKWVDSYMGHGQPAMANVRINKDRNVAYRVLMIDYAVPRPDHDAGSYAAVQEIRMLQANGCKVSFVADNMAHMGKYTDALQKMGVECFYSPFFSSVHQILEQRGDEFDLVYITRYDIAERHIEHVRKYTKAKVLFNNADLHFLRELRAALAAKQTDLSGPLATKERELALMHKVDGVLSYNPTEHAIIISHNLRTDNLYICPWVLDGRGHKTPFKQRSGLAFLGGYRHTPNVEAVEFFVEKVMPLLRKRLPGVAFHIYGSSMPKSFEKYEAEDVILEGFVESLDDVFESCRVFVAPLLSGAGIKGKVLEAMSAGVPSVLSPVAAEATGLTHGISAMVVEDPEAWAEAITELYENEERWQQISTNALTFARTNYGFKHGVKGMKKALEGVGIYPPNQKKALTSS